MEKFGCESRRKLDEKEDKKSYCTLKKLAIAAPYCFLIGIPVY
jgi:hypothetical protein